MANILNIVLSILLGTIVLLTGIEYSAAAPSSWTFNNAVSQQYPETRTQATSSLSDTEDLGGWRIRRKKQSGFLARKHEDELATSFGAPGHADSNTFGDREIEGSAISSAEAVSLASTTAAESRARMRWLGSVALKNNYVFSTGTEIDDKPVMQAWMRGYWKNGFFVDLWSNIALASGNPRKSTEVDYTIGYEHEVQGKGTFTAFLSYYDLQTPRLLEFSNDVWGPGLKWQKDNFFIEGIYFFVDGDRDGFRIANSWSKPLSDRLNLRVNLNYANGPYARREAVISKLALDYYNPNSWFEFIGFELSEILYARDDNDPRGFATTFTVAKNLF